MAMPQRDNYIEQIHRLEGLIAFAEQQEDWDEVERLKEQLRRLRGVRGSATLCSPSGNRKR